MGVEDIVALVGGIFHRREDALQVAEALILAGVERDSIHLDLLPHPLSDVLGPLGIPEEAIEEYETQVTPGDSLLIVITEALPAEAIANEVGRGGGLVIQFGYTPAGHPGER